MPTAVLERDTELPTAYDTLGELWFHARIGLQHRVIVKPEDGRTYVRVLLPARCRGRYVRALRHLAQHTVWRPVRDPSDPSRGLLFERPVRG